MRRDFNNCRRSSNNVNTFSNNLKQDSNYLRGMITFIVLFTLYCLITFIVLLHDGLKPVWNYTKTIVIISFQFNKCCCPYLCWLQPSFLKNFCKVFLSLSIPCILYSTIVNLISESHCHSKGAMFKEMSIKSSFCLIAHDKALTTSWHIWWLLSNNFSLNLFGTLSPSMWIGLNRDLPSIEIISKKWVE